jgi:hypothetical protein
VKVSARLGIGEVVRSREKDKYHPGFNNKALLEFPVSVEREGKIAFSAPNFLLAQAQEKKEIV